MHPPTHEKMVTWTWHFLTPNLTTESSQGKFNPLPEGTDVPLTTSCDSNSTSKED